LYNIVTAALDRKKPVRRTSLRLMSILRNVATKTQARIYQTAKDTSPALPINDPICILLQYQYLLGSVNWTIFACQWTGRDLDRSVWF